MKHTLLGALFLCALTAPAFPATIAVEPPAIIPMLTVLCSANTATCTMDLQYTETENCRAMQAAITTQMPAFKGKIYVVCGFTGKENSK